MNFPSSSKKRLLDIDTGIYSLQELMAFLKAGRRKGELSGALRTQALVYQLVVEQFAADNKPVKIECVMEPLDLSRTAANTALKSLAEKRFLERTGDVYSGSERGYSYYPSARAHRPPFPPPR